MIMAVARFLTTLSQGFHPASFDHVYNLSAYVVTLRLIFHHVSVDLSYFGSQVFDHTQPGISPPPVLIMFIMYCNLFLI